MPTDLSAELPETLHLPSSRARWVFTFCVSALIVGTNIYLVQTTGSQALGLLAFIFAITGIASGLQLIPGSGGLWLDRKGFVFRLCWYDRRREWKEITPIMSSQVGLLQMVGYNRAGDPPNKPREILPDTYGISANELADIMNHWRDTALRSG